MRRYSEAAIRFVGDLLPRYKDAWRIDYASFRPLEEEGRDLPWKKRNDLLHTDAFPTRPTNGDLILRFFTNINPSKARVWLTSDPFEKLAADRAADAGLTRIAAQMKSPLSLMKRAVQKIGVPVVDRSPLRRVHARIPRLSKRQSGVSAELSQVPLRVPTRFRVDGLHRRCAACRPIGTARA